MAETVPFKYRAFLSYSHRDTAWAKWLHARLEGFRIDKDLVGRRNAGRAGAKKRCGRSFATAKISPAATH